MDKAEINKRRLRGQCRRGMLELDVLLNYFFEHHYDALSNDEQQLFAKLLAQEDVMLYAYLLQSVIPDDTSLQLIIDKILAYQNNLN